MRSDYLFRLGPNGSVDTGFSPVQLGFRSGIGTSGSDAGDAIATGDNRIFAVTNTFSSSPGNPNPGSGFLRRYLHDGSLDPTFDPVEARFNQGVPLPTAGNIQEVELLPNGSLLVAGMMDTVNGLARKGAARIAPVGNVDTTFNQTQISEFKAIRQLSSGKIVVRTATRTYRLEADGTMDPTFQSLEFSTIRGWQLDSTERVVFRTDESFCRLDHDGTVLNTFQVAFGVPASITAAAVQADGHVVMTGDFVRVNGMPRPSIARVNAKGELDQAFVPGTGFSGPATKLVTQADNKVIAIGSFQNYNGVAQRAIARINIDGTLDTSFSPNIPTGAVNTVVLQPDGMMIVAGSFTMVNGEARSGIARLTQSGALDMSFNPSFGGPTIFAIALEADGKIMVGGTFSGVNGFNRSNIVRLNGDGSTDPAFNAQGLSTVRQIADGPDGRYVVFTTQLQRLLNSGMPDASFSTPELSSGATVNEVLYNSDGTLLIAGAFFTLEQNTRVNFMRLRPSGAIDQAFLPPGSDAVVRCVARVANDRFIVGGSFTFMGGVYRPSIARVIASPLHLRTPFDFDGDGRADVAVFRPTDGDWYEVLSGTGGFNGAHWGQNGDMIAPGDYDGDGKTDVAVFRDIVPGAGNDGYFFVNNSSDNSLVAAQFGSTGDLPVTGDWDGDGKDDLAVYRGAAAPGEQSHFYYRPSGSPGVDFVALPWGTLGDTPLVGDFDGDGRNDPAVFRPVPTKWYILNSSNGQFSETTFGVSDDIPVPADYDGDGRTNIAVFRPTTGYWYTSLDPQTNYGGVNFGTVGDVPAPADFDGDGRADIAVFRPSNGLWYMLRSTQGFTGMQFGAQGDRPVQSAFLN